MCHAVQTHFLHAIPWNQVSSEPSCYTHFETSARVSTWRPLIAFTALRANNANNLMYSNRTMVMRCLNNWLYFVIEDCFSSEHQIWDEHQIYFSERLILLWSEWKFQRNGGVPRPKQSRRQRCWQDVSNADTQTDEALERRVSIDRIITFVRSLNISHFN